VRNDPVMIAVSLTEVTIPSFGSNSRSSKAMAAKKPRDSAVKIFLSTGGHDRTSEVPGAEFAGWRLKLSDASPEIMLFLPKTASTVMSKRQTERKMKLKSELIFPGLSGWPAARPADT